MNEPLRQCSLWGCAAGTVGPVDYPMHKLELDEGLRVTTTLPNKCS